MTLLSRPASDREMTKIVPGEPLIAFHDVHIGFEDAEILRGISFEVWPGETKVLLGETGAGKTLIMKLAAGLMRADSGGIWVMGHNLADLTEKELLDFRRHLGFVFQEGALFDSLTVADNVAFRLREEHVDESEIETRVSEALRFVEMEPAIDKFPSELSGGMRRRVSIARALVDHPPLVFYDSPTAGLDPVTSQTIIALVMRGRDLQGVTSLLATHRVQDAFGLARFRFDQGANRIVPANGSGTTNVQKGPGASPARPQPPAGENGGARPTNVMVLRDGHIYFEGSAEDVLKSSDAYVKEFLASAE